MICYTCTTNVVKMGWCVSVSVIYFTIGAIVNNIPEFLINLSPADKYIINSFSRSSSKKYIKMAIFGLKTNYKKFFLYYFCPPPLPMQKNWVKMVPKQVFIGAGFKSPPPYRCPFQRPLMVGLTLIVGGF